jgi:hypothetical protein
MTSMKDTLDKPVPQDAHLNEAALQYMYAEFAQEESQLAEEGLECYARTLEKEEAQF